VKSIASACYRPNPCKADRWTARPLESAIPTVVVFVAGQRRLVDAMKTTGLK
jgi:ABC-type maltose transport system permease subunit